MSDEYQNEEWRPVPDDAEYMVSNLGRVKSFKRGQERILKSRDFGGYLQVVVPFEGRVRNVGVHRLVMLAFVGKCPDGYQVHHLDHKKHNNRLDNLLYVTPKENAQAAIPFRRVAERERERIRKIEHAEYVKRLDAAKASGVMSGQLAKERFAQLGIRPVSVSEVVGSPNTFDTTLASPLNEHDLSLLLHCDLYAYPLDLLSNDYRIIWCPDGD